MVVGTAIGRTPRRKDNIAIPFRLIRSWLLLCGSTNSRAISPRRSRGPRGDVCIPSQ